ncbi:short-chain dehydrogenase, partial [Streptomyces sp. SID8455]|nr:short-chain dehydrogenase [Streptomyces sp. SID8455]
MTKYARRRALVVGEATGIGLAIAKRLVEGGAS